MKLTESDKRVNEYIAESAIGIQCLFISEANEEYAKSGLPPCQYQEFLGDYLLARWEIFTKVN